MTSPPGPGKSLASRTWFALHCLPRDEKGRPPSYRSLELNYDLPRSVLSRLFSDDRKTVDASTLGKLAKAFRVSPEWLLDGEGSDPVPTGPVMPWMRFYVSDEIRDGTLPDDEGQLVPLPTLLHDLGLIVAAMDALLQRGDLEGLRSLQRSLRLLNTNLPRSIGQAVLEAHRKADSDTTALDDALKTAGVTREQFVELVKRIMPEAFKNARE